MTAVSTPGLGQDGRLRQDGRGDQESYSQSDEDREIRVYESSEARRSFGTSEFWAFAGLTAALLFFTYNNGGDSLSHEEGWRYAIALGIGYMISRGLAKAGSSEPRVRRRRI